MKIEDLVSPWKGNPSAQENFYELTEEIIEDIVNEEVIEDIVNEEEIIEESKEDDPYGDILKEI